MKKPVINQRILHTTLATILTLLVVVLFTGQAHAATITVCASGCDYTTIQEAITNASDTDVISISPGTYTEGSITVNKAVTIEGDGPGSTVISASSMPVFTITVNGVTLKDLEITHPTALTYGIVVNGATSDLTINNVHLTNLSIAYPSNAYGIHIQNGFSNLLITNSRFESHTLAEANRVIAIYSSPKGDEISNIQITNSEFVYVYVGVYINTQVNGLQITGNTFGPQELDDCVAAAAGVYIGDGKTNFDLDNIEVTNNTFVDYCRGFYMWNYADGERIGSLEINNNTFEDTIYSSGIRIIGKLSETQIAQMVGPVTINNNTLTQSLDIGAGVSLIDIRNGVEVPSSSLTINNNDITFSNGPFTGAMYGIKLRGPIMKATVNHNVIDGGGVGGSYTDLPDTSGIFMVSRNDDFGDLPEGGEISIKHNEITGFVNGVVIFDENTGLHGNLPLGVHLQINQNEILGNSDYGVRSGAGDNVDATKNWWGDDTGPSGGVLDPVSGTPANGLGDVVSEYVIFDPWLGNPAAVTIQKTVYAGHDAGASCPGGDLVDTAVGAPLTFCFEVTNAGTVHLNGIDIMDPKLKVIHNSGLVLLSGTEPLAPGASVIYYFETTPTNWRDITNIARVSATPCTESGDKLAGMKPVLEYDTAEQNVSPGPPVLLSPDDGVGVRGLPTNVWSKIGGATRYQMRYATDTAFTNVVYESLEIKGSKYQPNFDLLGTYYWQARAMDKEGDWSDWSAYYAITLLPDIPPTPKLISPANKEAINDATPTLDFDPVPYGDHYEVLVDDDPAFGSPEVHEVTGATEYDVAITLADGKYYWQVRAFNANNEPSDWSKPWLFSIDTTPPDPPTLITPANLLSTNLSRVTFKWQPASKDSGSFTLQVDDNDDFSSPILDLNGLNKSMYKMQKGEDLASGRYYWRVMAIDALGNAGGWSTINSFTITIQKQPEDGSVTNQRPVFRWIKVKGVLQYQLQINDSTDFSSPLVDEYLDGKTTSYELDSSLGADTYYWRIRYETDSGWSDWSPALVVTYSP